MLFLRHLIGNFKLLLPHIHLDAILLLRNVLTEESTDNQEEISYEPETNKKKRKGYMMQNCFVLSVNTMGKSNRVFELISTAIFDGIS